MTPSKLKILQSFFRTRDFTDKARLLSGHNSRFYPHSTSLNDYPVIDKRIFMQHFEDINAYGIGREEALAVALKAEESRDFSPVLRTASGREITVGLSSGTSGSRGIFLVSPEESALWAGYMLRRMLPRPYLARHSIAFFLRANSNLYTAVRNPLIRFEFYDLMRGLDEHVPRLNAQNPSILIAPAQVLQQLALRADVSVRPKRTVSVAEVLEPQVRTLVERRFGSPVHQIYQCTEGFLAHTCRYGSLHLNEDMVYIEKDWIDEGSGRFAPVITDFNRKSQPVIRYRLDDVLVADGTPCPCGHRRTLRRHPRRAHRRRKALRPVCRLRPPRPDCGRRGAGIPRGTARPHPAPVPDPRYRTDAPRRRIRPATALADAGAEAVRLRFQAGGGQAAFPKAAAGGKSVAVRGRVSRFQAARREKRLSGCMKAQILQTRPPSQRFSHHPAIHPFSGSLKPCRQTKRLPQKEPPH